MTTGFSTGLQGASAVAGILGSALGGIRNEKRLKKQARGQETAAQQALRSRLAAQNEQSAMRVAASQTGVNPAQAQRIAQQSLGQQQVQTNAMLAQQNLAQSQRAQEQLASSRQQRIQGTISQVAQLGNSLGAGLSVDAAEQQQRELGAPPTGTVQPAPPAPLSDLRPQAPVRTDAPPVPIQEDAAGLSAPSPAVNVEAATIPGGDVDAVADAASAPAIQAAAAQEGEQANADLQVAMASEALAAVQNRDIDALVGRIDAITAEQGPQASVMDIADLRDMAEEQGDLELSEQLRLQALRIAREGLLGGSQ